MLGDLVNESPEVMLLTANHAPHSPTFGGRTRPVVLEARSWVATGAMVLPGRTVGAGAIVAAGVAVAKDVARWTLAAGCPAREVLQKAQLHLSKHRRWFH